MNIRAKLSELFNKSMAGDVPRVKLSSLVGLDTLVYPTEACVGSNDQNHLSPPIITIDYGNGCTLTLMADKIVIPNE
jgi:hypothetical protein